jgi:hypothetical protein
MPNNPMRPQWVQLTNADTGESSNFNFDLDACNHIEPDPDSFGTIITTADGDTIRVKEPYESIANTVWPTPPAVDEHEPALAGQLPDVPAVDEEPAPPAPEAVKPAKKKAAQDAGA